jgi:hypothetical protein
VNQVGAFPPRIGEAATRHEIDLNLQHLLDGREAWHTRARQEA